MSRARKTKNSHSRTVTGTSKQRDKEIKLMESLQDAETRQLESFIKRRNRELDTNIKQIEDKIQFQSGSTSIENDSLQHTVGAVSMSVQGIGMGKVEFDTTSFADNVTKIKSNMPELSLDPSHNRLQPKTVKDHLVTLLARIKLKMEDVNMSPAELRELLLPSDLVVPDECCASIGDLTGVIQTDLIMPVSKQDQILILQHYGTQGDEVNVKALLMDAGVWYEGATSSAMLSPERRRGGTNGPEMQQHYPYTPLNPQGAQGDRGGGGDPMLGGAGGGSPMREEVLDGRLDPLPPSYSASMGLSGGGGGGDGNAASASGAIMDATIRNVDDLHELHELIQQEKEYDYGEVPVNKRKPFENYMPVEEEEQGGGYRHRQQTAALESKEEPAAAISTSKSHDMSLNRPQKDDGNSHAHEPKNGGVTPTGADTAGDGGQQDPAEAAAAVELSGLEADRLSALQRENERLKNEIGSFDAEFFEQLEDLKYRYSRLQEVVDEAPDIVSPNGRRKGALPLDRLSWSVRNSMTAMDRAGLTSPLFARPRYPNAHTYAPGGTGGASVGVPAGAFARTTGGGAHHIGGSIPASTMTQRAHALMKSSDSSGGGDGLAYTGRNVTNDLPIANTQYPPPLYHSTPGDSAFGGTHGIGAGTHAMVPNEAGGSFANLCERRLAFEVSQHPSPEQATRSLIHRVMDISSRNSTSVGFITCPQLSEVCHSVGLKLSSQEIELLATGFASNGQGGVDATEFCEAVSTLLYNFIGEHAGRAGEVQAQRNGTSATAWSQQQSGPESEDIRPLLIEMCEGIITHDKRAVIGNSPNIFKTLLRPFVEQDQAGSGLMDFHTFHDVLKDIGVMLTQQDILKVSRHFLSMEGTADAASGGGGRAESAYPTSNLNHIQSFRDAQLRGSLLGASKSSPVVGDFLASSGIGLLEDYYGDRDGMVGGKMANIDYTAFVTELSEILIRLIERDGGVVVGTKFPWILKEFEFVDALICQLEEMKPTQRRKILMSLQYALAAADPRQDCDLDGFAVLNALLSSGFRLQRVNRVRLLRAVEELGGKMDYRDLVQVLLNSCADWTSEEKQVVHKILKSMGVTVIERRNWLARLRQSLMDASSKIMKKSGRWFASEPGHSGEGADADDNLGIPPSAFLHCLRDCGVVLTVEEEATLLDCLDTERLSKAGEVELENGTKAQGKETWSIPMIEYDNFLHFCSRHCGSWTAAAPEINEAVKWAIKSISNPVLAVHEFASLMHAFDETGGGAVSKRAFQICCHRSRLLANLPDDSISALSDILSVDGGGKVKYTKFIVYLRSTASNLNSDAGAPTIIDQLVRNCTDNKGTILPLRNWLMRNTDMESFIMTPRDLNTLLREFSVIYRPEDLEELQMDIGKHVDVNTMVNPGASSSSRTMGGMYRQDLTMSEADHQAMKRHVVDSRDLLMTVLKARPAWTKLHPYLCQRMKKSMQLSGETMMVDGAPGNGIKAGTATTPTSNGGGALNHYDNYHTMGTGHTYGGASKKADGGSRGIETAVARRVLSRLRAFAGRSAASIGALDRETKQRDGDILMVERDIFKHLTGVTGLPMTDEDVLILADATDFLPEASRVRCDVILEALMGAQHANQKSQSGEDVYYDEEGVPKAIGNSETVNMADMTEAGIYALDHLRSLLWAHAARLHRTTLEWVADVRTVFKGFDKTSTGFISTEDFNIALHLLNAQVSQDLLMDISYVPEGPGLIDYSDILDYVLVPPTAAHPIEEATNKPTTRTGTHRSSTNKMTGKASEKETLKTKVQKKIAQKESPVQLLINVVRKSLHHFIISDHSLESAWVCLLKVFQRFDPQETNMVNPRDFCLAVSVLLDGDDVILTKSEWAEIIDHFAQLGGETAAQRRQKVDFLGGAMVDYMLFCETILDANEIKSRLYEMKANDKQSRLDRNKQQFLSRPPTGTGTSAIGGARGGGGGGGGTSTRRTGQQSSYDRPTSAVASREAGFQGQVTGSSMGSRNSSRPASASASRTSSNSRGGSRSMRSPSRELHVDKENDEILKRFQAASRGGGTLLQPNKASSSSYNQQQYQQQSSSYSSSGGGAYGYNNAGAAAGGTGAGTPKKSEWNTDNLYRVARTQGQASRVSARTSNTVNLRNGGNDGMGMGMGGGMRSGESGSAVPSHAQTYASSHPNRGNSSQIRFNWDTKDS